MDIYDDNGYAIPIGTIGGPGNDYYFYYLDDSVPPGVTGWVQLDI